MTDTPPAAPAPAPPPIGAPDPATAQSEIANLVRGTDLAFSRALASATDPGHTAALARWTALHVAAHGGADGDAGVQPDAPEPSSEPARDAAGRFAKDEPAPDAPVVGEFAPDAYRDLHFALAIPESVSPDAAVAIGQAAREAASATGLEPQEARGYTSVLESAIARRGNRPMDEIEMRSLDAILQSRCGDDLGATVDRADAALKRAGKHAPWLRQSLKHAGPETAAMIVLALGRAR